MVKKEKDKRLTNTKQLHNEPRASNTSGPQGIESFAI